ncbi:MAG: YfcC family protein [Calditrichia bacterium]
MSLMERIKIPHVFVLLIAVTFICSLLTYIIPSGEYQRQEKVVGGSTRTVIQPGTYSELPKHFSSEAMIFGDSEEGKASPVSLVQFLSAIPRGLEKSADIIFFIFIIGGVLGIIQRTGTITAFLRMLIDKLGNSGAWLIGFLMILLAVGGSTLGMGEEFIPLIPIFLLVGKELGYDRLFGLAIVVLAADTGFAAATTNPFTVNIAQGIAEIPLNGDIPFRLVFLFFALGLSITYLLRYGNRVKKDPSASLLNEDTFDFQHLEMKEEPFLRQHALIIASSVLIFSFILYMVINHGWWMNEMAGGFLLMGFATVALSDLSLEESTSSFIKGMEEMVVAALVVGFARAIEVVLQDGQIIDTLIFSAASMLQGFPNYVAAQGMLIFQSTLNFLIPSGSGQAAVTMPLMAPLADVLGISRQTAVFAFTCGDGFSNTIVPTSGVLMAYLSLAKVPYMTWLRFMFPLFIQLMVLSALFLAISVLFPVVWTW